MENQLLQAVLVVLYIQIIPSYDLLPQMANFINYVLTLIISSVKGHPFIAPYVYEHQVALKQR